MKFIEQLREPLSSIKSRKEMLPHVGKEHQIRFLQGIEFGDLYLSIQAGYGMHCIPRIFLDDLHDYKAMEIALRGADGEFVTVSEVLPDFPRLKEIEEYESTVYSYVPVDLIEDLYLFLVKRYESLLQL